MIVFLGLTFEIAVALLGCLMADFELIKLSLLLMTLTL